MKSSLGYPITFRNNSEGSLYCYINELCYYRFKIDASSSNKHTYVVGQFENEQIGGDVNPLNSFISDDKKKDNSKITFNEFEKSLHLFFTRIHRQILNDCRCQDDSKLNFPLFLKEINISQYGGQSLYCYFSPLHRISLDTFRVDAITSDEDNGIEEIDAYGESFFESVGEEYIQQQLLTHQNTCVSISSNTFILACTQYLENVIEKINKRMEIRFPKIKTSNRNWMSSNEHTWSCNICDGNNETGCLYHDPSECPR
jgi:hypothetical protein